MKKNKYITPVCETIRITENSNLMLTLSVYPDDDTEIIGSKEQGEFVEEEVAPTAPNLWGDTEEED